jgi:hypothetical protein
VLEPEDLGEELGGIARSTSIMQILKLFRVPDEYRAIISTPFIVNKTRDPAPS